MAQGNGGREKIDRGCVCCSVFDVSCQASCLRQLLQEISELTEIIGISTNQSRKLFTFLPDTSARQKLHIFIGGRSKIHCFIDCLIIYIGVLAIYLRTY
jgi:hypothetical protein